MIAALLGEGSSDRALLPILRWLLAHTTSATIRVDWVDPAVLPAGTTTLAAKAQAARRVYAPQLLFLHRDADNQPPEWRRAEIRNAVGDATHVAVVPVRTMEAWLLIDAASIRAAAGRPSGSEDLELVSVSKIEGDAAPKQRLHRALRLAHGATGRRSRRFDLPTAAHRLADLIEDWTPLRQLPAFQQLEADTRQALSALGAPLLSGA